MTGIALSVEGKSCFVMDKDGIVHRFKIHGEVLPGQTVVMPRQKVSSKASRLSAIASIAAAALLVVFGITNYRAVNAEPLEQPAAESVYYEDGELVIEDEALPLAAAPSEESAWLAYACWAGAGVSAIGAVALLVKGAGEGTGQMGKG